MAFIYNCFILYIAVGANGCVFTPHTMQCHLAGTACAALIHLGAQAAILTWNYHIQQSAVTNATMLGQDVHTCLTLVAATTL